MARNVAPLHSDIPDPVRRPRSGRLPGQVRATRANAVPMAARVAVMDEPRVKRSHKPPAPQSESISRALRHSPIMWFADICITLIVVIALFWFYGSYWTNIESGKQQQAATKELSLSWNRDQAPLNVNGDVDPKVGDAWLARDLSAMAEGAPLMKMYAPRLGSDWSYTVVKGVNNEDLAKGPGFYTSTQLPGQHGNTGIAGHRDGRGAPFFYLDTMKPCDAIVLESRDNWYIYKVLPQTVADKGNSSTTNQRLNEAKSCMGEDAAQRVAGLKNDSGVVTTSRGIGDQLKMKPDGKGYEHVQGQHITNPKDNSVIAPMPSDMSVPADQVGLNMLTLTTCNPLYFNYERLIIHAALVRVDGVKDGYVPSELAGVKV